MHARYGDQNRLNLAAGKPESTPNPGVRCDIPTGDEAMPLPLLRLPGVLPHMEWIVLVFQHVELGGYDQDPGGAPQTTPHV